MSLVEKTTSYSSNKYHSVNFHHDLWVVLNSFIVDVYFFFFFECFECFEYFVYFEYFCVNEMNLS